MTFGDQEMLEKILNRFKQDSIDDAAELKNTWTKTSRIRVGYWFIALQDALHKWGRRHWPMPLEP